MHRHSQWPAYDEPITLIRLRNIDFFNITRYGCLIWISMHIRFRTRRIPRTPTFYWRLIGGDSIVCSCRSICGWRNSGSTCWHGVWNEFEREFFAGSKRVKVWILARGRLKLGNTRKWAQYINREKRYHITSHFAFALTMWANQVTSPTFTTIQSFVCIVTKNG